MFSLFKLPFLLFFFSVLLCECPQSISSSSLLSPNFLLLLLRMQNNQKQYPSRIYPGRYCELFLTNLTVSCAAGPIQRKYYRCGIVGDDANESETHFKFLKKPSLTQT